MIPFLVDTLEEIVRYLCGRFIMDDVMEKTAPTTALLKLDVLDKTKQKMTPDVGFALQCESKN
jgi:hypothetical protein